MGEEYGSIKTLADGTIQYFDGDGRLVWTTAPNGAPVWNSGGSIGQQFLNLVDFGVRTAINANFGGQIAQNQVAAQSAVAQAQTQSLIRLAVIFGGAFLVYKLVRK